MTNRYLTHLSTIISAHMLILFGSWQMSHSDIIKNSLNKLGPGVLKLQIASRVMMNPVPEKKVPTKSVPKKAPAPVQKAEQEIMKNSQTKEQTILGSTVGTSAAGAADALSVYKAELRAIIDRNKYYPTMSRRLGQTGTVVVAFTLLNDGNIINVRIDKPSQYERLNDSALDAVKKVVRFKPIPKEIGEAKMDIKVPVKFVTI